MNGMFLLFALFSELAAAASLKLSQGFSKRLPVLALVVFSVLKSDLAFLRPHTGEHEL